MISSEVLSDEYTETVGCKNSFLKKNTNFDETFTG